MKNLIKVSLLSTLVTLSVSISAMECAKVGRYLRPSDSQAIELAKALDVSTCKGKAFKAVVKAKGLTIKIVKASKDLNQLMKERTAKRKQAKVDKVLSELSF